MLLRIRKAHIKQTKDFWNFDSVLKINHVSQQAFDVASRPGEICCRLSDHGLGSFELNSTFFCHKDTEVTKRRTVSEISGYLSGASIVLIGVEESMLALSFVKCLSCARWPILFGKMSF